jgi:hypothetical protein
VRRGAVEFLAEPVGRCQKVLPVQEVSDGLIGPQAGGADSDLELHGPAPGQCALEDAEDPGQRLGQGADVELT